MSFNGNGKTFAANVNMISIIMTMWRREGVSGSFVGSGIRVAGGGGGATVIINLPFQEPSFNVKSYPFFLAAVFPPQRNSSRESQ